MLASVVPTVRAYDPAFAYEIAVIVQDGLRRMYEAGEPGFYYLTVYNEMYAMPPMPAGVEDGTRIRLTGEGEAGQRGGSTGDLYIFLSIKPHAFFQRDGADLYCRVPISMVQAALGGEFSVRAVDGGDAKVRVPEGAQSGRQLRIRGKGMPALRSRDFGDLYIQVNVETPQNLTRRQRELLAEFDAESSHKTHPESAGFFSKMKEFFEGLSGQ